MEEDHEWHYDIDGVTKPKFETGIEKNNKTFSVVLSQKKVFELLFEDHKTVISIRSLRLGVNNFF